MAENPVEMMQRLIDRDVLARLVDALREGTRIDDSGDNYCYLDGIDGEQSAEAIVRLVERDEAR